MSCTEHKVPQGLSILQFAGDMLSVFVWGLSHCFLRLINHCHAVQSKTTHRLQYSQLQRRLGGKCLRCRHQSWECRHLQQAGRVSALWIVSGVVCLQTLLSDAEQGLAPPHICP